MYQFHVAPVPRLPPVKESIVELPGQITEGVAVEEVGMFELILTVTIALTHVVVLHELIALTQ